MLLATCAGRRAAQPDVLARELGGLSRNHLHKIVQELTALGLTRTARGTGGGALAVAPETARLGSPVRQLEADQPVVECFRHDGCALHAAAFLPVARHVADRTRQLLPKPGGVHAGGPPERRRFSQANMT
jgi:DNA-binding IscR family transcriptional regulator